MVAAFFSYMPGAPGRDNSESPLSASPHQTSLDDHRRGASEPPDVGVNTADKDGQTPLHYATFSLHTHVVAHLLDHGAHPTMVNIFSLTPLYIAAPLS